MGPHWTKSGEGVGLLPAGCVSTPQTHRGLTRPRPHPRIPPPLLPAVGSPRPGPRPRLPAGQMLRRSGPAKPPPGRGRAPPRVRCWSVPLRPLPVRPAPARGHAPRPTRPAACGDGGPAPVATATALRSSVARHRWRWGTRHPKGPRAGPGSLPATVALPQPENCFSPAGALKFRYAPTQAAHQGTAPSPATGGLRDPQLARGTDPDLERS